MVLLYLAEIQHWVHIMCNVFHLEAFWLWAILHVFFSLPLSVFSRQCSVASVLAPRQRPCPPETFGSQNLEPKRRKNQFWWIFTIRKRKFVPCGLGVFPNQRGGELNLSFCLCLVIKLRNQRDWEVKNCSAFDENERLQDKKLSGAIRGIEGWWGVNGW